MNYTVNKFYLYKQNGTTNNSGYLTPRYSLLKSINSGKVTNFTITPSGGNFTIKGNYSFSQPASLSVGEPILIRLFLNTSNYPNTVAEYHINSKIT